MYSKSVLDDYGNFRSELYQNLYAKKYDIMTEKQEYQRNQLYNQKQIEEKKAYAQFTGGDTPFSSFVPGSEELSADAAAAASKASEAASSNLDKPYTAIGPHVESPSGQNSLGKSVSVSSPELYHTDAKEETEIDPETGLLRKKS
jgi:hypothetical protein